jgi:hypothetical protein
MLTPPIQRHVAFESEFFSSVEVSLLVEMVEDRCVNRSNFRDHYTKDR